jgi:hypothetical protein
MREIEAIARAAGAVVVQAKVQGRPVRPGECPEREGIDEIFQAMLRCGADRVILVEQPGRSGDNVMNNIGSWCLETYGRSDNSDSWPTTFVEVDHHDPAQTWPPEVPLWQRSSLGQIAPLLGVELTGTQRWIGALDHDLPGALREAKEMGVLNEVLLVYSMGAAKLFGGVEPEVYVEQIKSTAARLADLGVQDFGGDLTVPVFRLPPDPATAGVTGEHYPLPALPAALALAGLAGLSIIRRKDGLLAWRLQCASPRQVRFFVETCEWVKRSPELRPPNAPYGQPERGFAGGLVEESCLKALSWFTGIG